VVNLIGAHQSIIDALDEFGDAVARIQRQVGYTAEAVLASAAVCQPLT
jgi:hypothetical protein